MSAPIRVKICGITNRADAVTAAVLGADALGFNLFPGSKRHIDLDENSAWIAALPPFVTRIAVLVNVPLDEARRVALHPAVDLVQLHGDEDADYCARLAESGRPFIKALRIRDRDDIACAADYSTSHLLIDAHVPGAYGGMGAPIDLALAREIVTRHPDLHVILAGGLTPVNVADAVHIVRPFAVDVASGVEREPRRKDAPLMAAFIDAARRGAGS
jgi:phosphoribosylanthranilate isomerase